MAGVYLSEAPFPPKFLFAVVNVGFESCQIQNVKLLQNMVSNRTQHPPPPASHTLSVYTVQGTGHREGEGGGGEPERRLEGQ